MKADFSLEDMDLTELKGKATYAQIKEYVLKERGKHLRFILRR